MISGTCLALVSINASHEVSIWILWQFLHDMNALVVFALGVDDFHRFVFRYDNTLVTHLSTHLTIEWSVVEYQFIEYILLLCYLTIT